MFQKGNMGLIFYGVSLIILPSMFAEKYPIKQGGSQIAKMYFSGGRR
jgi:hypothetical protein